MAHNQSVTQRPGNEYSQVMAESGLCIWLHVFTDAGVYSARTIANFFEEVRKFRWRGGKALVQYDAPITRRNYRFG